jgi:2-polyprenyl-6-methoxyphenol hydroxylase-like FAD-dependent oxidoreductase
LLAKIPPEKIHFSKKVLSLEQNKEGVMIRCADGTTYHGDILVGADGAYSGVRQALYKRLAKYGKLPPTDANELNKGFICMVGTTKPLDPAKYPGIDGECSNTNQIIGKKSNYCVSFLRTCPFFCITLCC